MIERQGILGAVKFMAGFVLLLWIILLASAAFPIKNLGIVPRTITGLVGVAAAPFLHQDAAHLIANSFSLFVLGTVLIALEKGRALTIMISLAILGGFGTWLIGRPGTVHIGASGLVFGLLSYLFFFGVFKRDLKSIIVSIAIFFLYGGAVWGVIPSSPHVSWESHLCGFIAGIPLARYYARRA
ncbi:MAG TPA: rhomboid family intramembrane serine protease [Spirochaetota bacterium]|nr:rhomboid family intramembrane serine protease [Spirochaetota bacterium]HOS39539.1 rhomboid family intramembrane serine protease [Spirochaetota bacterium]HPU87030.1 rhomboid family intramembrane serine protease [Spirochaetota bacterium]